MRRAVRPRLLRLGVLAAVALGALAAAPAPAAAERVLVAFGDSLTAGFGVAPGDSYPAQLERRLAAAGYPYRVVNAGVSGDTTAGGLRRVDWALRARPAVVIVVLGGNDGLRGLDPAATRANLEAIVARFQQAGAAVLLGGMRLPPNYGRPYGEAFRRVYETVARARKVPLMPFFLDGVAGDPRLNLPDGIHPTGAGYRLVVDRLWPHLLPLLAR